MRCASNQRVVVDTLTGERSKAHLERNQDHSRAISWLTKCARQAHQPAFAGVSGHLRSASRVVSPRGTAKLTLMQNVGFWSHNDRSRACRALLAWHRVGLTLVCQPTSVKP